MTASKAKSQRVANAPKSTATSLPSLHECAQRVADYDIQMWEKGSSDSLTDQERLYLARREFDSAATADDLSIEEKAAAYDMLFSLCVLACGCRVVITPATSCDPGYLVWAGSWIGRGDTLADALRAVAEVGRHT